MTIEFGSGATSGVLRLAAIGGGWVPVHMTINRVELDKDTYAGLVALRLPTAEEIAVAGGDVEHRRPKRKPSPQESQPRPSCGVDRAGPAAARAGPTPIRPNGTGHRR